MLYGNEKSKNGQCEVCDKDNIRVVEHYGNMWFCPECWDLEVKASIENMAPMAQEARVQAYKDSYTTRVIETSRVTDDSIQIIPDIITAKTTAILDIKKAIDADSAIQNKPYALAEELTKRFEHFKKVIFDAQQLMVDAGNEQKAIQIYLNNMANTLKAEERERLKIDDINYKPTTKTPKVKSITTHGAGKAPKEKVAKSPKVSIDKVSIREAAILHQVDEYMLQFLVVSKGITIETAIPIMLRHKAKKLAESKSN